MITTEAVRGGLSQYYGRILVPCFSQTAVLWLAKLESVLASALLDASSVRAQFFQHGRITHALDAHDSQAARRTLHHTTAAQIL